MDKGSSGIGSLCRVIGPTRSLTNMLPIRFAYSGLTRRLLGLTLLLLLGGTALSPVRAGPLEPFGVDDFRRLIDPKYEQRELNPEAAQAPSVLADYRRK